MGGDYLEQGGDYTASLAGGDLAIANLANAPTVARPLVARIRQAARPRSIAAGSSVLAVAIAVALGTLMIGIAYAGGRAHDPWATIPFWVGSVGSFMVLAGALTSPLLSARARLAIVLLQAFQQSFVRWMYDPLSFTFPDELQHWRTAADILTFHHLFHSNPTLAVSPVFPGLEEMATSLVSIAHMSLFAAGLTVATTSHVALAAALFCLYRRVSGSDVVGGLAAFVFALNPLHAGFDSQFIYEAPALVLGAVVLHLALSDRRRTRRELCLALLCLAALVVTHHLTAAVIIASLAVLGAVVAVLTGGDRTSKRLLCLALAGVVMAAAWVAGEASPALSYLGVPLRSVISGILHVGEVSGTVALPATTGTSAGALLTLAGTGITAVLVLAGVALLWRRQRRESRSPVMCAFALCALAYFGVLAVREFAPDGAEMAGRLLTFAALFTAIPIAVTVAHALNRSTRVRTARFVVLVAMLGVFLGGMMSGWPAPWEQLPGAFHVAGFESGIDRQNMEAVRWFRANIAPNQRVACDVSSCSLLGAYAEADPIPDEPSLFYDPRMDRGMREIIHHRRIQYIFVDLRMTQEKPITGQFFQSGSGTSTDETHAVSPAALAKFRNVPGIQLVYDSGVIEIFSVGALDHG